MFNVLKTMPQALEKLAREEDGAQVIEYAMIIAVVSLGVMFLLATLTNDGGAISTMVDKVKACLAAGSTTCAK